eukprot:5004692-Prymnesium_polylepis.1
MSHPRILLAAGGGGGACEGRRGSLAFGWGGSRGRWRYKGSPRRRGRQEGARRARLVAYWSPPSRDSLASPLS